MRLLELHYDENEMAELHCNIHVVDIPEHGQINASPHGSSSEGSSRKSSVSGLVRYQALSHSWGPEGDGETAITVITDSSRQRISIRPDLIPCIRKLRKRLPKHETTPYFWIDAICIDQNDPEDKNRQIPRMADIYSGATQVCVWLGEASATSHLAISFIETLRRLETFDKLLEDPNRSPEWNAFFELARRPWFGRRWIVQEIAVARQAELLCGDDSVKWEEFADAVSLFASNSEYIRQLFNKLEQFQFHPDVVGEVSESAANRLVEATSAMLRKTRDGSISEHMLSLEALITTLPGFSSSDPHDDIFAVLWLSYDGVRGRKEFALGNTRVTNTPVPTRSSSPARQPEQQEKGLGKTLREELRGSASDANDQSLGTFSESAIEDENSLLIEKGGSMSDHEKSAQHPPTAEETSASNPWSGLGPETHEQQRHDFSHLGDQNGHQAVTKSTENISDFPTSSPPQQDEFAHGDLFEKLSRHASREETSHHHHRRHSSLNVPGNSQGSRLIKQRTVSPNRKYPEVNYTKAIFDVYKEFIEFAIAGSKQLDLICFPWAPTHESMMEWWDYKEKTEPGVHVMPEVLPSWIRDKTGAAFSVDTMDNTKEGSVYRRVRADPLVGRPGTATRSYLACGKTRAQWEIVGKVLKVLGQVLGEVGSVDLPALSGNIPSSWLKTVKWQNPKKDDLPDKFWRTLVADRGVDGRLHPSQYYKLACRWAFGQRVRGGNLNTTELMKHGKCNKIAKEFLSRVQAVVYERHLITVEDDKGLIGLAPLGTKEGDLICVLDGCSVPVLLRKIRSKENAKHARRDFSYETDSSRGRHRKDTVVQDRPVVSLTNAQNETENITERPAPGDVVKGNKYEFLGECYILGMMSGEAFQYMERKEQPREFFELE